MKKFEEFNELLRSGLEQIDSLRNENPAMYWLGIFSRVIDDFQQMVAPFIEKNAIPYVLSKIQKLRKTHQLLLPVHFGCDPQRFYFDLDKDYVPYFYPYLYYLVHVVAHNEQELSQPKSLTTCFLCLKDGIYMMMPTFDERGMMLEIFPPHFWNRYAYRVKRNSLAGNTLPVASLFEEENTRLTFDQMKQFTGYFVGRNWFYGTIRDENLFSLKKQKNNKPNEMVTVFVDGFAYDSIYWCEDVPDCTVIMHKTYMTWSDIGDDQRAKIIQYKKQNLSNLLQEYPNCLMDFLQWMNE